MNGNGKSWQYIVGFISVMAVWTGAVLSFGMHVGNHDIHTPFTVKANIAKQAAKDEVDHLKELLLSRLDSIDETLKELEED